MLNMEQQKNYIAYLRQLPLSVDKKITVNGLPHGNYELVVCSVDGMGNRLGEVYRLAIRITPPWYLSRWAKLIYLLMIGLLIWGVRHFYYVRKKLQEEKEKRRKILEQQEMRSLFSVIYPLKLKNC